MKTLMSSNFDLFPFFNELPSSYDGTEGLKSIKFSKVEICCVCNDIKIYFV